MEKIQGRQGIWISQEIIDDTNLDWINKVLLSEIISLSKLEKGCIASNETFGKLLNLHRGNISKRITFLEEEGYVSVVLKKLGEKRTIRNIYPHEGVSGNAQRTKRLRTEEYADTHKGVSGYARRNKRERSTTKSVISSVINSETNSITNSVTNSEQINQDEWINNFLNKNKQNATT